MIKLITLILSLIVIFYIGVVIGKILCYLIKYIEGGEDD